MQDVRKLLWECENVDRVENSWSRLHNGHGAKCSLDQETPPYTIQCQIQPSIQDTIFQPFTLHFPLAGWVWLLSIYSYLAKFCWIHQCYLLRVRQMGKCQGRVVELSPRSSFDIIWGCANSEPGRLRILGMTQMDGLGFSLCAALLDIVRSCISKWQGQDYSRAKGGLVYSRLERGRGT